MNHKRIFAYLSAIIMVATCSIVLVGASSADAGETQESGSVYAGDFLLDRGNGDTLWLKTEKGGTYVETVESSLEEGGIPCSYEAGSFTIEGKESFTVGGDDHGGGYSSEGTTGFTTTCQWNVYSWSEPDSEWMQVYDPDQSYDGGPMAVGFYPDGVNPVETPEYKSSWTMVAGDAENSVNQTAEIDSDISELSWYKDGNDVAGGCYSPLLVVRDHVIAKFGNSLTGATQASIVSYDLDTGEVQWEFDYDKKIFELTCALVVGQYVYVQSSDGHMYRIPWEEGPGEDYSNVTELGGEPYGTDKCIPNLPPSSLELEGLSSYGQGPYTMVFDSGSIFLKHHFGMVYCFDMDLNLQWSYQMMGGSYYTAPTVCDGYVAAGAYNGHLYILDETDGTLIADEKVFAREDTKPSGGTEYHGAVNVPIFIPVDGGYRIFTSFSDGMGMNSKESGIAICDFDGITLTVDKLLMDDEIGSTGAYLTRCETGDRDGILANTSKGTYYFDKDGSYELITDFTSRGMSSHAASTLVNGEILYFATYAPSTYIMFDLDGNILGSLEDPPISQFSMSLVTVVDGMIFCANDMGFNAYAGVFEEYVPPATDSPMPLWQILLTITATISVVLALFWAYLRFHMKWEHPFADLRNHIHHYFYGEEYRHNVKSKRKLHFAMLLGILLTLGICLLSLCAGSHTTIGPIDAVGALVSALSKGGKSLTADEYLVYIDRMPRIMAALGAGIGLSVAGAMYQAVIKNPLVEPYIMGVSAGAGTVAIAVMVFDFTLFGLLSPDNPYLVAICSIIGGLLAFACTMILAEKTGGKSINFVLAGIVVGLVFSAVQSLMIIKAGNRISSALGWLYGSFNSITWEQAWIVLIPALAISFVPLVWAKELNLVLLGEDQAKQMGLNAKMFDRLILIIASILTSFCVAFCGIIGFVGLVIPHLSRMILGGDHRMMLPVTITLGGFMMVLADLLARTLVTGFELPVGAVTAIVGVPVFAYLLIKRRRSYDV